MTPEIGKFLKQDFDLLDSARHKLFLIGFIGLYSAFFINAYTPFNINNWGQNSYFKYVMLGVFIISITQFALRPLFGLKTFKFYSLMLWAIFELFIMATVLHLVYAPTPHVDTFEAHFLDYLDTIRIVLLVATVPYTLVILYLMFRKRISSIKEMEQGIFSNSDNAGDKLLTITGENDKVVLAIKQDQLLCIKSAGNYLELYYLNGEKLAKELVRARLKELEEKMANTSIVKVHRSYMINSQHISSLKKTKKSYELIMQYIPDIIIPVSVGFKGSFEEALRQNTSH